MAPKPMYGFAIVLLASLILLYVLGPKMTAINGKVRTLKCVMRAKPRIQPGRTFRGSGTITRWWLISPIEAHCRLQEWWPNSLSRTGRWAAHLRIPWGVISTISIPALRSNLLPGGIHPERRDISVLSCVLIRIKRRQLLLYLR